jgi:hypothetical protein
MAAVIFAALAAHATGRAAEPGDEALSATGAGRIALSLDGRGYLHETESGSLRLGLRWPGAGGTEFLGGGGLLMRFVTGKGRGVVLLGPGDFEPGLRGTGIAEAQEGCRGGKRYPADGCDDDGDGAVDEDPLDGRDNDGDGETDEDFAAVGDGMYVTSSLVPSYGIRVTRTHYVWNYGHVRDFIGFSTTIEYLPPEGFDEVLRDFEMIHYIDFDIGDRDDAGRGRDDRSFLLQALPDDGGVMEPPVAAVSGTDGGGPLAAVVIFGATGPDAPLIAGARARKRQRHVDSLWSGEDEVCTVLGGESVILDIEGAEVLHGKGGQDVILSETAKGDIVLVHTFGKVGDIYPGDKVEIEWAIVFGKDCAALTRNISRARETWEGIALTGGERLRWVVPARRAVRIEARAALAPVWVQGEKRPAVSIDLPSVEGEEIEWLKVAGEQTDDFETVGGRVVIALEETAASEPFAIEGQLTDGTIFTSYIGEDELQRYAGEDELQPGRLPEDSIRLFPNPFVEDLTIDVLVYEPSRFVKGMAAEPQTGISSVRVYDVKGRLVRTILTDKVLHPGEHALGWDGADEAGMKVAAGVYYCRLQIGERSLTRRVILLR